MQRILFVSALAMSSAAAGAQAVDTPHAAACLHALEALQAQEAAAAAQAAARRAPAASEPPFRRAANPELEALRGVAAQACLGSRVDTRPAAVRQVAQPPVVVPPIAGLQRVSPASSPGAPPAPSPLPNAPPTIVTSCDPTGCWTNTGTRLPRAGPNLVGPNGICTLQGVILHCP